MREEGGGSRRTTQINVFDLVFGGGPRNRASLRWFAIGSASTRETNFLASGNSDG